jgi:hypothetical protein
MWNKLHQNRLSGSRNILSTSLKISIHIISLRVEIRLFVLIPEIEDRDEIEVLNWAKHKKTFYSE